MPGIQYLTDSERLCRQQLHADTTPLPAGASSIDPQAAGPLGMRLSAGAWRAPRN